MNSMNNDKKALKLAEKKLKGTKKHTNAYTTISNQVTSLKSEIKKYNNYVNDYLS